MGTGDGIIQLGRWLVKLSHVDGLSCFHGLDLLVAAFVLRVVFVLGRTLPSITDLGRHLKPIEVNELPEMATFVNRGTVGLAKVGELDSARWVV